MAVGTPFHARVQAICHSYAWRQWSGYLTVSSFNDFVQPEYAAIRNAAALIDISPLYKYEVSGPQAAAAVDHVITHHAARMRVGQVIYTPWCDADGAVRQEGTIFRLAEDRFMIAAAEPAFEWFRSNSAGFKADYADRSTELASLSLQGPHSRAILAALCGVQIESLRFFHLAQVRLADTDVMVSRTGYTGDLGYELWIPRERALQVWDALIEGGKPWQITPCGILAMDVARVEAGFIMIGVDYVSAELARLREDRTDPYELGLGWTVKLDKGNFIGRRALQQAANKPPRRMVRGLQIDWEPLEEAFMAAGLMPDLPMTTCREPVPLYSKEGVQVGRVTSRVWSKLLKKYIGIATIDAAEAEDGNHLEMEITVHYRRARARGTVMAPTFFRPERLKA